MKEPGELLYTLQGEKVGMNEFSFKILRTAVIDCRLKDQYRIKFVDPQDSQTFDTPLWRPYLDWFAQLTGKSALAIKNLEGGADE